MEEPQKVTESGDKESHSEAKKRTEPDVVPVKKRDEKIRRKDEKTAEQVLKALTGSNEEKLAALCKKYADVVDENKKLQVQIKQYEKKVAGLTREKSQLETEQGKLIVTRSRLEGLCRELQKQNKQVKEESLNRIKEEEEKRKTVSEKFQLTLGEITQLMQQNNENNSKLRDENLEIQAKFKSVCEKYELREQQIEKMSQQMKLESQLAEAQLTKIKIEMLAEKEVLVNEKQQLLMELAAYKEKCQELQKIEAALKFQIQTYTEKYDKFQGALAKSNELYGGFKSEIEKMSKKIVKLEKETSVWKSRWENNHKVLLQVAAEKQQKVAELSLASRQVAQLQKLCRVLQADRSSLLTQLKSEGFTPKLSGEYDCADDSESKSQEEEIPTQNHNESEFPEVLENGKDDTSLAEIENCEVEDLKETTPETKEENEEEEEEKEEEEEEEKSVAETEQPKETNKAKPKVKTKKGKDGSKNRKK